jgi:two-component system phosphate regulon sensor histidine kinase PhoR
MADRMSQVVRAVSHAPSGMRGRVRERLLIAGQRLASLKRPSLMIRLLAPSALVLAVVAASLYAYGNTVVEGVYVDTVSDAVLGQARLAGSLLPWDERGAALDQRCAAVAAQLGSRVTVIDADGTVLGDSEVVSAGLENHRDRPEVWAALHDGSGQAVRVSNTVHRSLFYRAWLQTRGEARRVIRLAVPMSTINRTRHRIRSAIWGGVGVAALIALLPALIISRRLSRRLSQVAEFSAALAAGEPPPPLAPEGQDTISRLEANLISTATSFRQQLQAVHEEKGKLEAVLSGMVEGVLVIDRSGIIRLSNQRAELLFGGTAQTTLVGQPLITVSRDPTLLDLVRAVTRGDRSPPHVCQISLQRAGRETLRVTATPMAEPDGIPQLFIFVFHDITELKKLEATRRDFVANVSHELRTPLTAIRGYAETLLTGALDDRARAAQFLGVIERHSERMGRLIDDLLTLSDLELGRTALQRRPMALAAAVAAALDVVHDKAERGEVEICRDIPADLPPLYADADRVEQVLLNLIDNAVKYTPAGGRVTVSAREVEHPAVVQRPAPGVWVDICVADTGIGVPQHDLPRLTERFYRVDKARSRELGGTGLGLAIVKHIVQAHGGALQIESEVGRGTQVHVYLPAADRTLDEA